MLERDVEAKLKWLEGFGFEVLKLRTPGVNGAMDRLILAPTWSPAPPAMVEIKRPGKSERALQAARRDNWRARGCDVRDMCSTVDEVQGLCDTLLCEAVDRLPQGTLYDDAHLITQRRLPAHICLEYVRINSPANIGVI